MSDHQDSSPETTPAGFNGFNCDREPIHIPGAIQPHGALLAASADRGLVTHASQNLSKILGRPAAEVLGRPLREAIGEAACLALQGAQSAGDALRHSCTMPGPEGCALHLRSYQSGPRICVDLEPIRPGAENTLPLMMLQAVLETFKHAAGLKELCELAVRGLKDITGYDRVMAYRFAKDGHGEVIAEAIEAPLESFLGLRYPAGDVPPQARRQYLTQRVGAIADSAYQPVPLLSDPAVDDGSPLDLSFSALRSVSPMHRRYMRNMGTAASLTIGLAHGASLWGMLVCHHGTPRIAGPELRAAADMIGQVVSLLIDSLGEAETLSQRLKRNVKMHVLFDQLSAPVPLLDALAAAQTDLLDLVDARGAVVRFAGPVRCYGQTPSMPAAEKALTTLLPFATGKFLAVDDLGLRYPELAECTREGSGALLLPLGQDLDDAILWFRPELVQAVTWGGNPAEHVISDPLTGEISPRASFASWKDTVRGRSVPWSEADISIASDLRGFVGAATAQRMKLELATLQHRYQDEQRIQNTRLRAALENMGDGLAMYDANKRLVVCNSRFGSIYKLPAELQQAGTPFYDIVAYRVRNGIIADATGDLTVQQKIDQFNALSFTAVASRDEQLADGHLIRVTRQPMSDGGWVGTHEDITERHRHEAQIAYLAHHDTLTGLANRSLFKQRIATAEQALATDGAPFGILMLDLDRFKTVNDSLGHAAGDDLLKQAARRLQDTLRSSDTLARLGGDEFAIVQSSPREAGLNPRERAVILASRIIDELTQPFKIDGHSVVIGTSIGMALAPDDATDPEDLLKRADLALYDAKSAGRNCYRFFDPRMTLAAERSQRLEADMRHALDAGEFALHYQPVVDVATEQVRGVEALLRWQHPTLGLLAPGDFVPLAEATGLIVPLGEWVIQQACRDASRWPAHIKVAVNLSAVQFRKSGLLDTILSAMVCSGLLASRLEVEITESVLLEKKASHLTLLHQLKSVGVSVALDDFGTGYSSLSYLKMFPFDKIKIDRSLIKDMAEREDCAAIVRSIIELGRSLKMATTAEGIETEAQFGMIRAAGATLAQGYLFGRPVQKSALDFSQAAYTSARVDEFAA